MLKTIAAIAAGAMLLAGCATTSGPSLERTCSLIDSGHAAFQIIAVTGKVPTKTVIKEQAAYDTAHAVCAAGGNITTGDALILAAQAYVTITTALRAAEKTE